MTLSMQFFLATLGIFLLYALIGFQKADTAKSFFHLRDPRKNLVALIVANVTLGTGLAYILTASSSNGLLMLSIPIGIVMGYWLLAKFYGRLLNISIDTSGNFLNWLHNEISIQRKSEGIWSRSIFNWTVTLPLILIYLLVFAFEIFVSSQILAPLTIGDSSGASQWTVAILIFLAAFAYATIGGLQSVFRNDQIQFLGILGFVGLVLYGALSVEPGALARANPIPDLFSSTWQMALNSFSALIAAVATQFYSLLNMHISSNIEDVTAKQRLLKRTGFMVAVLLSLIVFIGALSPYDFSTGFGPVIEHILSGLSQTTGASTLFVFVLIFGMTSIVISTVDTLMISLTMFVQENFLGRKSPSNQVESSVASVRLLMTLLFGIGFTLTAVMFALSPNLFYLLLSIANGPIVFAPLLVLAGLLAQKNNALSLLTNRWLFIYLILFSSASFSSFAILKTAPQVIPYLSLIHLFFATALAIAIYRRAN